MNFVDFTGEETEKEFLEKIIEQWSTSAEKEPVMAMIELGSMISEVRLRVEEMEDSN